MGELCRHDIILNPAVDTPVMSHIARDVPCNVSTVGFRGVASKRGWLTRIWYKTHDLALGFHSVGYKKLIPLLVSQ